MPNHGDILSGCSGNAVKEQCEWGRGRVIQCDITTTRRHAERSESGTCPTQKPNKVKLDRYTIP